jgi:hypothetical protein
MALVNLALTFRVPQNAENLLTHLNTISFSKTILPHAVDSGVIVFSLHLTSLSLAHRSAADRLYHSTAPPRAPVSDNDNAGEGVGVEVPLRTIRWVSKRTRHVNCLITFHAQ